MAYMGELGNIVIGGKSALHLHLHCDGLESIGAERSKAQPLTECASTAEGLSAFNTENPLYGGRPVTVLVSERNSRRTSSDIRTRCLNCMVPDESFAKLKDGLFVASPELTFALMGYGRSIGEIAEAGLNLCGRYFLHYRTEEICRRREFLVTPQRLRAYLARVSEMRGSGNAAEALKWIAPNSGSPMESKTWLVFCLPRRLGGFNLPFDAMNFDVSAGRLSGLTVQSNFSIDMVCSKQRFGLEYDGRDYHEDAANDKRRRNELSTLGWRVFPIEKDTLYDAEATERTAHQLAHQLGARLQDPTNWETRYAKLRSALELPS